MRTNDPKQPSGDSDLPPPTGAGRRAYLAVAIGFAFFILFDHLVFHTGLYFRWISPSSNLGAFTYSLQRILQRSATNKTVLVLGDSRIAEGFSDILASSDAPGPINFTNGAVPGTTPRVWNYLLREVDRPAERLAAVVIMLESYHDDDQGMLSDRLLDLTFIHPFLRLSDIFDLEASFPSNKGKFQAVETTLISGLDYQNDVQDFLSDPEARLVASSAWAAHGQTFLSDYKGHESSLEGLTFNLQTGDLSVAPPYQVVITPGLRDYAARLRAHLTSPLPENAQAAAYRRLWLGRLADYCAKAGAPLIVIRIPRGPLHGLSGPDAEPTGSLAQLKLEKRVAVVRADAFDEFESPKYFFDQLHLNRTGREIFSSKLAAIVASALKNGTEANDAF